MTNNRIIINGPEAVKPVHNVKTGGLYDHILFELPDGRWGIKLHVGAIIFTNNEDDFRTESATVDVLHHRDDLRLCRILPGNVEITYKP